jgi:hypothetical protein
MSSQSGSSSSWGRGAGSAVNPSSPIVPCPVKRSKTYGTFSVEYIRRERPSWKWRWGASELPELGARTDQLPLDGTVVDFRPR